MILERTHIQMMLVGHILMLDEGLNISEREYFHTAIPIAYRASFNWIYLLYPEHLVLWEDNPCHNFTRIEYRNPDLLSLVYEHLHTRIS